MPGGCKWGGREGELKAKSEKLKSGKGCQGESGGVKPQVADAQGMKSCRGNVWGCGGG